MELAPPGIFMAAIAPKVPESTTASTASLAFPQKTASEQHVTPVRTQQSGNQRSKPFLSEPSEAADNSDTGVDTWKVPSSYGAGIPVSAPAQPAIQSVSHQSNGPSMHRPASLKDYLPSLKQLVPVEFFAELEALASLPSTSKASASRATVNKMTPTKTLCTDGNVAVNAAQIRRSMSTEQNTHATKVRVQDDERVAQDDNLGSIVPVKAGPLEVSKSDQYCFDDTPRLNFIRLCWVAGIEVAHCLLRGLIEIGLVNYPQNQVHRRNILAKMESQVRRHSR